MDKALVIFLAVAAVLSVKTNATEVQLCGSGATDTTSVQLSDCGAERCVLTAGSNVSLAIRFTPTTTINSLTTDVSVAALAMQIPLPTVSGQNACNNIFRASDNAAVSCPLRAGVQYIFRVQQTLSKGDVAGDYKIHWGLKQGTITVFCFEKDIRVT